MWVDPVILKKLIKRAGTRLVYGYLMFLNLQVGKISGTFFCLAALGCCGGHLFRPWCERGRPCDEAGQEKGISHQVVQLARLKSEGSQSVRPRPSWRPSCQNITCIDGTVNAQWRPTDKYPKFSGHSPGRIIFSMKYRSVMRGSKREDNINNAVTQLPENCNSLLHFGSHLVCSLH